MANVFSLAQTFSDTGGVATTTPAYTAKPTDDGFQGVITAGPNGDPGTSVVASVQADRGDGLGFVDVGGVSGGFGMVASSRGGPLDTPATIQATTYCQVQKGWKVRGSVLVSGTPVTVSFAGNTF